MSHPEFSMSESLGGTHIVVPAQAGTQEIRRDFVLLARDIPVPELLLCQPKPWAGLDSSFRWKDEPRL